MKNHFTLKMCSFLILMSGYCVSPSAAQTLASHTGTGHVPDKGQGKQVKTLKQALTDLEARYKVSIMYKSELIEDNEAGPSAAAPIQKENKSGKAPSLEQELQHLLKAHGLKYDKINPSFYVILPGEDKNTGKSKHPQPPPQPSPAALSPQQEALAAWALTGKVTSARGEALPGVTVVLKGTTNGTSTDEKGAYTLQVPEAKGTLVFSYIGTVAQEVPFTKPGTLNVVLKDDTKALEEVVVVGYGTQKKASVTGSVASVDSKEIKSINTANLVTGLAGKLPGLRVTQRNSEPGAYATAFDIRGFGTPLVVVDGIVRNDFNKYDPNEIESITVLKDASAAVYGVQAANGVILVTTKKGAIGKPVISYSINHELQEILNTPKVGDAYQFAVLTTENEINLGKAVGSTTYTPEDIQKFKDGTYPSTDWLDVLANKYGYLKHHNLNITGGSEKIKY